MRFFLVFLLHFLPMVILSVKEKEIEVIHIGKTGGTTLESIIHKNWRASSKGKGDPTFQIPLQVKKLTHIQKPDLKKYNSFIVTCRNPLDRVKSWFFHSHPKNHLLNDQHHEYRNSFALYECYEQLDDLLTTGLHLHKTDRHCQELARNVIKGKSSGASKHYLHMLRNYRFYLTDLLNEENSDKEIFVVRTEQFYEDLQEINTMLGGGDVSEHKIKPSIHRKEGTVLEVSNREVTKRGQFNACLFLCPEIQLYKKLLQRAINLSKEDVKISLEQLSSSCRKETENETCSNLSY